MFLLKNIYSYIDIVKSLKLEAVSSAVSQQYGFDDRYLK